MTQILTLATAGLKPDQLADTENKLYPRVDYLELQRYIDLDVIDYRAYEQTPLGSFFRYIDTQVRSDLYLAFMGFLKKRSHKATFAMSERVGIPLAGLHHLTKPRQKLISMFTCWSQRQEIALAKFNLFSGMDSIIVKCQSLKDHFIKLGVPEEKVHLILFGIDQKFFKPLSEVETDPNFALSLGEIRSRDYATLLKAVNGLPMELIIAASGSWYAREKKQEIATPIPSNTHISGGYPRAELKKLYARASFVILPVYESLFSAGATAILEAMCMGKAVIVTRSPGILDYVIEGETGILVESGNEEEMRHAVNHLLANPQEAKRLGDNGRQRVEEELNIDKYVQEMANFLNAHTS